VTRRNAAAGFTIAELMIVATIVGILAMWAFPSMTNLQNNQRLKTTSLDLYMSLVLARSEAIKRNTGNVSMIAAGGWQGGWTVCVDANANGVCDAGEVVLISEDPVDTKITITGPGGNIVTYGRDGRPTTGATSFTLTAGTNNHAAPMRCVDVDVSGRPRTRVDTNNNDADGCN